MDHLSASMIMTMIQGACLSFAGVVLYPALFRPSWTHTPPAGNGKAHTPRKRIAASGFSSRRAGTHWPLAVIGATGARAVHVVQHASGARSAGIGRSDELATVVRWSGALMYSICVAS